MSDLKPALDTLKDALKVYTRKDHPQAWADAQIELGDLFQDLRAEDGSDQLGLAVKAYERALTIITKKKDPHRWARTIVNYASAYGKHLSGDLTKTREKAFKMINEALTILTKETDPKSWSAAKTSIGIIYLDRIAGNPKDNIECAINAFNEALAAKTLDSGKPSTAASLMNLGLAYSRRLHGDPAENKELALDSLQRALTIWIKSAHSENYARTLVINGEVFLNRLRGSAKENLQQAIMAFREGLKVPLGHRTPYAQAHLGIALLRYRSEGFSENPDDNLDEAIESLEQALGQLNQQSDLQGWAGVQHSLGIAYRNKRERQEALAAYTEALRVYSIDTFPRQRADIWANLANLFADCLRDCISGDLEEARKILPDAVVKLASQGGRNLQIIEKAVLETRSVAASLRAKLEPDKTEHVNVTALATELMLASWTEAIQSMPEGETRRADFLCRLGEWQMSLGLRADAIISLEQALDIRDSVIASTLTRENVLEAVSKSGALGETLAYCLIKSGNPEKGLVQLERSQAAELRRMISKDGLPLDKVDATHKASINSAFETLRQLQYEFSRDSDFVGHRRSGAQLAGDIRKAQANLKLALAAAGISDHTGSPMSAAEILSAIPPKAVLIAPLATSSGGAAYILPHGASAINENHVIDLPDLSKRKIDEQVKKWRAGYQDFESLAEAENIYPWTGFETAMKDVLGWLWDALIQPVLQACKDRGIILDQDIEIIILTTGGLSHLPLQAAWDCSNDRYLIDAHVVSFAPNLYSLKACWQRAVEPSRGIGGLVGLFNAEGDDPDDALMLSEGYELPQLDETFHKHGKTTNCATGRDATSAFLIEAAPRCAYLHLSCHGTFDWAQPERSGLLLAEGELMDLRDIAGDLHLYANRLVSIAACDTALTAGGPLASEQIGLPAAFLQAGAPAVIAALWPVEDSVTAMVMARVYDLLLSQDLRPAEALRQATLELRAGVLSEKMLNEAGYDPPEVDYESPFFWAPLITMGY